ncbi:MAG: hypothetical protein R3F19_22295 [Verrucomicrobiales bacterium]
MWFERFVIIVTTLARDFIPGAWDLYSPTWVEVWTFVGTFGLFMMLFLLFLRFLPVIAMSEVKGVLPESDPHYDPHHTGKLVENSFNGAVPFDAAAGQPDHSSPKAGSTIALPGNAFTLWVKK